MDGAMVSGQGEPGRDVQDLRVMVERLSGEVHRQAALVDELRARPERERRGLSRAARLSLAGLLVFLIGTVPSVLAHTGYFSDVPHGAQFHTEINEIAGAGITTGCTATPTYCPDDTVTRKAMAAFMSRGFGRALQTGFSLNVPSGGSSHKDFQFQTGLPSNLLSGAHGYVKMEASFSMGLTGQLPTSGCFYQFYLTANLGQPSQVSMTQQTYNVTLTSGNPQRNITLTGLASVSTTSPTLQINIVETNGAGACGSVAVAAGDAVTTYVPLSGVYATATP